MCATRGGNLGESAKRAAGIEKWLHSHPIFKTYDGPSAQVPGESNAKRIRRRNAFKDEFLEYALSPEGRCCTLLAVTFTYPPSASEDSLYGDMIVLAKRVASRPGDSLWVVSSEAQPREPSSHKRFHWHGIAILGSGHRDQDWLQRQWIRRVGANRHAIDVPFLRYSNDRDGHLFEGSAVRWINYCCRAPPPPYPMPLKFRVVASGFAARLWERAVGHPPVTDAGFEPHTWLDSGSATKSDGSGRSPHGNCWCPCRLPIPSWKRKGTHFINDKHKDRYHNLLKKEARAKESGKPPQRRRPKP